MPQTTAGIGTPQVRCREMHQSGRVSIICAIRFSPLAGIQRELRIWSSARCRRPFASIEMNHCGVERNSTGFLQRQQWG